MINFNKPTGWTRKLDNEILKARVKIIIIKTTTCRKYMKAMGVGFNDAMKACFPY